MDDNHKLLLGFGLGLVFCLSVFYFCGIIHESFIYNQLAKPCLDQGYTKAKCREMIYIPQSEVK